MARKSKYPRHLSSDIDQNIPLFITLMEEEGCADLYDFREIINKSLPVSIFQNVLTEMVNRGIIETRCVERLRVDSINKPILMYFLKDAPAFEKIISYSNVGGISLGTRIRKTAQEKYIYATS